MDIRYAREKDCFSITLCGELDESSAGSAREILDRLIVDNLSAKKIIFDLSETTFMDSTGIGLLIGRYKTLKRFDKSAYITGANVAAEKVIQLSGLYNIMPKY